VSQASRRHILRASAVSPETWSRTATNC
jgi:hypothetical protein